MRYPLDIPNPPKPPIIEKRMEELSQKKGSEAEQSVAGKSN